MSRKQEHGSNFLVTLSFCLRDHSGIPVPETYTFGTLSSFSRASRYAVDFFEYRGRQGISQPFSSSLRQMQRFAGVKLRIIRIKAADIRAERAELLRKILITALDISYIRYL